MTLSDEKKYLIEDKPITARELINAASLYDEDFKRGSIKSTSMAAAILREYGFLVSDNNEFGGQP